MYIKNIKIKNFRNIKNTDIFFDKNINFILGNNAQGKTNIVESIYTSAFLKSFRTNKLSDLIRDDSEFLYLNLDVCSYSVNNKVCLFINNSKKILKVNNKKPDDYNYLNVIIFYPEEINYIASYPVFRRNLIDRSIFYNDYSYLELYRKYNRCLKQRNSFLKEKNKFDDYWVDQLIEYGSKIIKKRISYINKINSFFVSDDFRRINSEEYFLNYSKKYPENSIEDSLKEDFSRKQVRERQLGYTLVGPHKEDIIFSLNGKPASVYASQGQKRSMVISYKTAQILDYKSVQGHYPVLILDDMTSELDAKRKNTLLENLLENSGQVFITSTDFKQTNFFEKSKVFTVNNGVISEAD